MYILSNRLNINNRTIFCRDNLDVLQVTNSDSVDLIYLDPPFNKNRKFTAPIGSSAAGAEFSDIFREDDVKDEWLETIKEDNFELQSFLTGVRSMGNSYNYCYLAYMAIRLIECQRILKRTGSIYLHCDPTMSHYLKLVMDCVFGGDNFRNEIIWHYRRWTGKANKFQRLHDIILFYTKTNEYTFNPMFTEYTPGSRARKERGVLNRFKDGEKTHISTKSLNKDGVRENDVWQIPFIAPSAKERTGYPTQKPLALLERIIEASSNEGDMVLDPFCGCATTCIAAERLNRGWVGIDISVKAYDLVRERLEREVPSDLFRGEPEFKTSIPSLEYPNEQEKKYVYIIENEKWVGEYKVGIANDAKKRLSSYQTSDPERQYKLLYSIETPYFRELEKYIHRFFDSRHEWVRADVSDIKKAIKTYIRDREASR